MKTLSVNPKVLAQPLTRDKCLYSTPEVILIKQKTFKKCKEKLTFLRGSHDTEVVQLRQGWTQTVTRYSFQRSRLASKRPYKNRQENREEAFSRLKSRVDSG